MSLHVDAVGVIEECNGPRLLRCAPYGRTHNGPSIIRGSRRAERRIEACAHAAPARVHLEEYELPNISGIRDTQIEQGVHEQEREGEQRREADDPIS